MKSLSGNGGNIFLLLKYIPLSEGGLCTTLSKHIASHASTEADPKGASVENFCLKRGGENSQIKMFDLSL